MKTKFNWISLLILASLILSACSQALSTAPAVTPTLIPSTIIPASATKVPEVSSPAPTEIPDPLSTATLAPKPLVSNECSVKDTGKKILTNPLREDGALYTWTVADLPDEYKNCAILFEGRFNPTEEQHHVAILSTGNGVFSSEFDANNFQHAEGSFWVYDPDWDMQNVGGKKASIGEMFVWDKRANMINNAVDKYNWPIFFHRIGQDTVLYDKDATMGITTPSCELLTQPAEISVSFAPDYAGPYIASIGADRCYVAIRDLAWGKYLGAVDDFQINYLDTFRAVMFPANTTAEQVQEWIDSQQ